MNFKNKSLVIFLSFFFSYWISHDFHELRTFQQGNLIAKRVTIGILRKEMFSLDTFLCLEVLNKQGKISNEENPSKTPLPIHDNHQHHIDNAETSQSDDQPQVTTHNHEIFTFHVTSLSKRGKLTARKALRSRL